jgi:hypothetical protein
LRFVTGMNVVVVLAASPITTIDVAMEKRAPPSIHIGDQNLFKKV